MSNRKKPCSVNGTYGRRRDADAGCVLGGIVLIALIVGGVYWGWTSIYNSTNQDVVDSGAATRMYSDFWGRWVEIDDNPSDSRPARAYHVDENAWTTIRIGDVVTVYAIQPTWELLIAHRISISAAP